MSEHDPFADEMVTAEGPQTNITLPAAKERVRETMRKNERPLPVANNTITVPADMEPGNGLWDGTEKLEMPAVDPNALEQYSRVGDLAPGPGFYKLDELDGIDIILLSATKQESDNGPYLTLEFDFKNPEENPDPERGYKPYVVNMGGAVAMPKVVQAMLKIKHGRATGPLVCMFLKKHTSSGQKFWDVM